MANVFDYVNTSGVSNTLTVFLWGLVGLFIVGVLTLFIFLYIRYRKYNISVTLYNRTSENQYTKQPNRKGGVFSDKGIKQFRILKNFFFEDKKLRNIPPDFDCYVPIEGTGKLEVSAYRYGETNLRWLKPDFRQYENFLVPSDIDVENWNTIADVQDEKRFTTLSWFDKYGHIIFPMIFMLLVLVTVVIFLNQGKELVSAISMGIDRLVGYCSNPSVPSSP